MESEQKFFYRIPFFEKETKDSVKESKNKLHIVGIIDASGSMSSWWKYLAEFWNESIPHESLYTITFDGKPRECTSNILSQRIQDHGGGMTAIPDAFSLFEEHLNKLDAEIPVTAIFISDGQDNNLNTLEQRLGKLKGNHRKQKINFICLGIQSGFPYFLSMKLREMYHNGDETIPALFLIEHVSEKAFFNKFEGMRNYFYSSGMVTIDPPVNIFPWDETVVESAYEGTWVVLKSKEISLNEGKLIAKGKSSLNSEELENILRGWCQQLQIVKIKDKVMCQDFSKIALAEALKQIKMIQKETGIDLLELKDSVQGITLFLDRAKTTYALRTGRKVAWYYEEINDIVTGKNQNLSEYEIAKRANLGTITGKYQQKLLALQKIKVPVFQKMLEDFTKVVKTLQLPPQDQIPTEQLNGILKTVTQPGFVDGLAYIKNQFDFLESITFTEYSLSLKRYEGYEHNPWLIESKLVLKTEVDTPLIIEKDLAIETKTFTDIIHGTKSQNQATIPINSILIIFDEKRDSAIIPLIKTDLIRYFMSFLCTFNYDEIHSDAYLAIVASTVQMLYSQPKSKERDEFIQKCLDSVSLFYADDKDFIQFANRISGNLPLLLTEHPNESLLKIYIHLILMLQRKQIDKPRFLELQELLLLSKVQKLGTEFGFVNILKPEFKKADKDKLIEGFVEQIDLFYSLNDLRTQFSKKFEQLIKGSEGFVQVSDKILYHSNKGYDLELKFVEKYSHTELNHNIENLEYCYLFRHLQNHPEDYLMQQVQRDFDILRSSILSHIDENNVKLVAGYTDVFKEVQNAFNQKFRAQHFNQKPMSQEQLKQACLKKNIDPESILYYPDSCLVLNACLSESCPHFLVPQTRENFKKHLDSWQGLLPQGFHRFVKGRIGQEFPKIWKEAKQKWGAQFWTKYGVTQEFTEQYIKDTLISFTNLQ